MLEAAANAKAQADIKTGQRDRHQEELVEAAGIEPCRAVNPNPMMAREFGCYRF
jgi:hypothetical protein